MKNDYVILILSCASYSDLWSNHIHLLDTFWSNHSDYLLVSDDNGLFDLISFEQLLVIKKDMSSRLIDALQRVKSKYVFLTFDDYYLKKNVDQSKFEKILNYIKEHDIDYCGFHRNIKKRKDVICKELKLSSLSLEETYQINFYSSIWKREALISCLRQKEDIWKAEVLLTKRARSNNLKAIACYDKSVL
ncbi:MAG TPA: hypothetical protein GX692_09105, partial [Acholeplasmataceae bacterium]|nr:hypothetical protein [Acholeplasmataceae bacterium]